MYIMPRKTARWTIASARQRLPALISSAAREPQPVYRRDQLVAAVISPELCQQLTTAQAKAGRPRLADALAELRKACTEEAYALPRKPRRDRANPMAARRR
jgi:hypothetical protein